MDFLRTAVDPDTAEAARQASEANVQLSVSIALIAAGAALLGALIGAMTSYLLQRSQFATAKEHDRTLRRDAALAEFVSAQDGLYAAESDDEIHAAIRRLNRAHYEYALTLNAVEQRVYDFATGVMRNSARSKPSIRSSMLSHGNQMLIDWTRGVITMDVLKPFEIISTDEHGMTEAKVLPHWPDRPEARATAAAPR